MNFIKTQITRMGQALQGGVIAAAFVAAAALAPVTPAQAQVAKKDDGSTICTYTSFTYDSATNTLVLKGCSGTTPPPPPPPPPTSCPADSFSSGKFSLTQATNTDAPATSTNTTVMVTRSYNLNGRCNLTWTLSATNGATATVGGANTGTITFEDNDYAPRTLTVTTTGGTSAGVVTVNLAPASGTPADAVGPFANQTFNVAAASTGGGNPPPPGCSTSATKNDTFVVSNQKITFALKAGETGAVAFTPTANSTSMTLSTTDTVNTPAGADHEVTITTCPGDFSTSVPAQCRYQVQYTGTTRWASVAPTAVYQCPLVAGTTYYMNVRQVIQGSNPPTNSCTGGPAILGGACEVRLQNTGL